MTSYRISGYVSKGFERVRTQFENNFINGLEKCAQVCVYVGEEKVVDLWGSVDGCREYDGDTITNVFSSTKTLTAICIAKLVDQNLLDYGDTVIKHWPEYGDGDKDKESMTIADILRHEGGMANFTKTVRLADILRENIKKNSVGRIIEKEPVRFPSADTNSRAEYHALTRGWILNEIFRRVDPQHRTIGEFLREEISKPLNIDCYIGLEFEQLTKSYELSFLTVGQLFLSSFIPKCLGRKTEFNAIDLVQLMAIMPKADNAPTMELLPPLDFTALILHHEMSTVRMGEIPSTNGQCSARGLAKIAAMVANDGTIEGHVILSKDTCERFHSDHEKTKILHPFGYKVNFSQGGVNYYTTDEGAASDYDRTCSRNRDGYIGWFGLGGSVCQWRTDYKVGFAYVPTFLAWEDILNSRGALLQKIVLDCVRDVQNEAE